MKLKLREKELPPVQLRLVECDSCAGKTKLKVFACALLGECTIGKQVEGVACCATCPHYSAAGEVPHDR